MSNLETVIKRLGDEPIKAMYLELTTVARAFAACVFDRLTAKEIRNLGPKSYAELAIKITKHIFQAFEKEEVEA
jgi:hypothetical protein